MRPSRPATLGERTCYGARPMRDGLVAGLIQGELLPWLIMLGLWLATAALIVSRRAGARRGPVGVITLLVAVSFTSLAGLSLSQAVAVPRLRWRDVPWPAVVAPEGETWRKLRGPVTLATTPSGPDIALASLDGDDWALFGLLSGARIEGLPPALPGPINPGSARLCREGHDECRPWPIAWPPPTRPTEADEFVWSRGSLGKGDPPLAYDVETGQSLHRIEPARGAQGTADLAGPFVELIGRVTTDPPRTGPTSIFIVRTIAGGRLRAARVVSVPVAGRFTFHLQRADHVLTTAPAIHRAVAKPLLLASFAAAPIGVFAYLLAPRLFLAWLRRRRATRRELPVPLVVAPLAGASQGGGRRLAMVREDGDLGDAMLAQGTLITVLDGERSLAPIRAHVWFELPAAEGAQGEATRLDERGSSRVIGALVPADGPLFRRAAAAWISGPLWAIGALGAGLSMAAPAVVAIASLIGSR